VSQTSHPAVSSPAGLRHRVEIPFYLLMVALNIIIIIIILAILRFAAVLPFVPPRNQDAGWAIAIRSTFVALLLLIPGLILVRETQRAATRGTAVELSRSQYPDLYQAAGGLRAQAEPAPHAEPFPGQRQRHAERLRRAGYRPRLRGSVQRTVRQSLQQQPGRAAVHPRPRTGGTSGCTTCRCGTRSRWPTRSRSRCSAPTCPACASIPATGTAPSWPRTGRPVWSCSPRAGTPRPTRQRRRTGATRPDTARFLGRAGATAKIPPVHGAPTGTAVPRRPLPQPGTGCRNPGLTAGRIATYGTRPRRLR